MKLRASREPPPHNRPSSGQGRMLSAPAGFPRTAAPQPVKAACQATARGMWMLSTSTASTRFLP